MATTKTFSTETPTSSDLVSNTPNYLQNDKAALEERFELEHNSLTSASGVSTESPTSPGRHKPGYVAAVFIGATEELPSTGIVSGCLAYDTTVNCLKIYNGTDWTSYSITSFTPLASYYFKVILSSNQSIPHNVTTRINFNSVLFDSGSFYDTTNYRLLPTVESYWILGYTVEYASITSGRIASAWMRKNAGEDYVGGNSFVVGGNTNYCSLSGSTCEAFNGTTDYIDLACNHSNSSATNVIATRCEFWGYCIKVV